MSSTTTALPLPVVPPDVLAFAEKVGVAEYLPAVLAMTRQLFPTNSMQVFLEGDPEIADDWHIILEVQIPADSSAEELIAMHHRWNSDVFHNCPARYISIFRLGVMLCA